MELQKNRQFLKLISIVLAGETIFMLPFLIPRLYRPLIIEAWNLSNTQIGIAFSAYGITAMLSYLFGGPIADKYHPRFLMAASLVLTALGGFLLSFLHSPSMFIAVYTFFGVSTTLLMWGALIRTTHIVGGEEYRSTALGLLDGGRGLTAALATSLLVLLSAFFFPSLESFADQQQAVSMIYWTISGVCLLVALFLWLSLKDFKEGDSGRNQWTLSGAIASLRNSKIWLLCVTVFSAYCGYKGIDNYSIYLVDVQHQDLANSSAMTSTIFWLRPFAAIGCGFLADYWHRKNPEARFLFLFILLALSTVTQFFLVFMETSHFMYAFASILLCSTFVYGLRAIYFSVFGDLHIPNHLVGTATCFVSLVGFLPDVFFAIVTGSLIDNHPGALGFQYTFLFTSFCLGVGTLTSYALYRKSRSTH